MTTNNNIWLSAHYMHSDSDMTPQNWSLGHVPVLGETPIFKAGILRDDGLYKGPPIQVSDPAPMGVPGLILAANNPNNLTVDFAPSTGADRLNVDVQHTATLQLDDPIANRHGADVVVTGQIGSNLYLSGAMSFGSYTQNGGTLMPNTVPYWSIGLVFEQAKVVLNCGVMPSTLNTQIAAVSGASVEVNGPVGRGLQFVMNGVERAGGEGKLIIDHTSKYLGNASLLDSFVQFKDLHGITSYDFVPMLHNGFQQPNAAIQLWRGHNLAATELFYQPIGNPLAVGESRSGGGTFIYSASDAQMAGFGLTKLGPMHT